MIDMKKYSILLLGVLLASCSSKPEGDNHTTKSVDVEAKTICISENGNASFWYDTSLAAPLYTKKEAKHVYVLRDSVTFSDGDSGSYSILFIKDSLAIQEGLDSTMFSRLEFKHNNRCIKTEDNDNGFVGFNLYTSGGTPISQNLCKVLSLEPNYHAILLGSNGRPFVDELLIYVLHKDSVTLIFKQASINLAFRDGYHSILYSKLNYDEYLGDSVSIQPWSHLTFFKDKITQCWDNGQHHTIFKIGTKPTDSVSYTIPKPKTVFNSGSFLKAFNHHRCETFVDDKTLDTFSDLHISENQIQEDSVYAIILAYCLRDDLDGAFAEVYFYNLYKLFTNRPNEVNTLGQKLLLIPEGDREKIKSIWKEELILQYYEEHCDSLGEWNSDSIPSYWRKCKDSFSQHALIWP